MKEDGSEMSMINIKRKKEKAKEKRQKDSVQHEVFFNGHPSKF